MVGKVKDDEAESVRIFVAVRSVVFFEGKVSVLCHQGSGFTDSKGGWTDWETDVKKTKETVGLAIKNVSFSQWFFNVPTTGYKELIVFQRQNHDQ